MITLVEDTNEIISYLEKYDGSVPFCTEILSQLNCYPPKYGFVDYMLVKSDDGQSVGAMARYGSVFTVFLSDARFSDETADYLGKSGAKKVICPNEFGFGAPHRECLGPVLSRSSALKIGENTFSLCIPDLKDYYRLMSSTAGENFTPPAFDDFYVDASHRLRHKSSRAVGVCLDGRLVSAVMTLAESRSAALLGGLVCDKKYRGRGIGSFLISVLTNELTGEGRRVFLYRARGENTAFYKRLGFEQTGVWREYYFD